MTSVDGPRGGSSRAALTLSIIALLVAVVSLVYSGWKLQQQAEAVARLSQWSAAMEQHQVSDLSFAARSLLTHITGELHIAQFLCSQSSDPALRAKADYLEQAVEGQSQHSTSWSLSHQGQEDELDRIDARLASGSLESSELDAISNEIAKIKADTQTQLDNIWKISSQCLEK